MEDPLAMVHQRGAQASQRTATQDSRCLPQGLEHPVKGTGRTRVGGAENLCRCASESRVQSYGVWEDLDSCDFGSGKLG